MNWIHPEYLGTTFLMIPLVLLCLFATWWHRRKVDRVFGSELGREVLPRLVRTRRSLSLFAALAGLLLGCLALAEPAFDKEIANTKVRGVDLVIAIDLSRSMDATDVSPSRLERARREISDLLDRVAGDRVAVVLFAGEAVPRLPLTEDHRAVEWVLEDLSTDTFQAQGSDLARAIEVSRDLLARDEGKAGKALIVFSDGETHDPARALEAAQGAVEDGLVIYGVGIGDAAATIPTPTGPLTHQGAIVETVPDFTTLFEVARLTGGAYVKSVASASDMDGLYNEIRSTVEAVQRDTVSTAKWKTAFQVPLGIAVLLWLAGGWLGDGRRRFGAAAAVLLMLSMPSSPALAADPVQADRDFRAERYPAAERAFEELAVEDPSNPDWFRRLGATRYRLGDYVGAAKAFERASQLDGGDADALYNAGNARYRAGELETALERFDQATKLGEDGAAAANRQLVESELAARRAVEPPPPPEPQEGGDEGEEGGEGEDEPQDGGEQGDSEPSDGSESGDQESGEQGDQEGQQDQEQSGSADEQGDPGEQDSQQSGQQGEPKPGEGDEPEDSESTNPDELDDQEGGKDGENEPAGGAGEPGMGDASGNITPAQAERMIDGVEEGKQRVRMVGRSSDKPW